MAHVNPVDHLSAADEAMRHGDYVRPAGVLRLGSQSLPIVSPARVYVCGITPYDVTHVGHAATFVWADVAIKVMRGNGTSVISCRNVTDVDDVLTSAAAQKGRYYDEHASTQEFLFDRTMRELRVASPTHAPRAGTYIDQVIQLAIALVELGSAYEREGRVYLRGSHVPAEAGIAHDDALAQLLEYGDHPDDPLRDDPFDVPVWQPSGAGDPAWPSPWGPGRPGWHAECAAMAMSVLGPSIDLLAGGADLQFPHHAYQSTMVQALTGQGRFARAELAVGTVQLNGAKMAKSTGNLVLVDDVLEHISAQALRLYLLDRPWSEAWDYNEPELQGAADRLERLRSAAGRRTSEAGAEPVLRVLLHELDVPRALDLAEDSGGRIAETVLRTLSLDSPTP